MKCLTIIIFSLLVSKVPAQIFDTYNEDSLKSILRKAEQDTIRVKILNALSESYFFKDPDSCLKYATETLNLSRRLNYPKGIFDGLFRSSEAMRQTGQLVDALRMQFEMLELSRKLNDKFREANALGFIGYYYLLLDDYPQAIQHLRKALAIYDKIDRMPARELFRITLGVCYSEIDQPDSAFFLIRSADVVFVTEHVQLKMRKSMSLGYAFKKIGRVDSARTYFKDAYKTGLKNREVVPELLSSVTLEFSNAFEDQNVLDSSFYYAWYSFNMAKRKNLNPSILGASSVLSRLHRNSGNLDSAFFYKDIADKIKDDIYGDKKFRELQLLVSNEERRAREAQQAEERRQNRVLFIGLGSILAIILVASTLLFRSNKIIKKANVALGSALTNLKSTQSQLIQSEKMASLGELTAGIAHEIQNPLNFINNFSEINAELLQDLNQEIEKGNLEEVRTIAMNVNDNQEKINHHGKRADGIVKSMLQHSRSVSGQKELTDINTLCDEYIRLAYHGFRAKDKSFNAKFQTDLDPRSGKVKVVPQEIGRVILNLVNNAFYAVSEKAKNNVEGYEPLVRLKTRNLNEILEIRVSDNGNGIPSSIREKVFQPFFTTKPTGQGTGLGLSLAYDIITKAHGGELKVETTEGAGSDFIILLPLLKNT